MTGKVVQLLFAGCDASGIGMSASGRGVLSRGSSIYNVALGAAAAPVSTHDLDGGDNGVRRQAQEAAHDQPLCVEFEQRGEQAVLCSTSTIGEMCRRCSATVVLPLRATLLRRCCAAFFFRFVAVSVVGSASISRPHHRPRLLHAFGSCQFSVFAMNDAVQKEFGKESDLEKGKSDRQGWTSTPDPTITLPSSSRRF